MTRLPLVTGQELIALLAPLGFVPERQRGSHVYLAHPDGRTTVVPVHRGEQLGRGLLRAILRDAVQTVDYYLRLRG